MLEPEVYPHSAEKIQHIETHISHIFLAGAYAYKVKKPLNLGFLDFSSLTKRKFYCREEIRLNRRLTQDMYLKVVAIIEKNRQLRISNLPERPQENTIEYAVCMRRFKRETELDNLLLRNKLSEKLIVEIADKVAAFHLAATVAPPTAEYGTADKILEPVLANFSQISNCIDNPGVNARVDTLKKWSKKSWQRLKGTFVTRHKNGFIRECHGDMHLANMVYWQGQVHIFDGIEFNPHLRWIDVISEAAFLVMDLDSRQRSDLAISFLNRYLAATGDYVALELINYYLGYRAVVRAKVAAIRLSQADISKDAKASQFDSLNAHLELAAQYSLERQPFMLIMHGLSGSGKSTLAKALAGKLRAVVLRSDLERKRLFGLLSGSNSSLSGDMYSQAAGKAVYQYLLELALKISKSGWPVIIDATFLKVKQRKKFKQSAEGHNLPALILNLQAKKSALFSRVTARKAKGRDISDADTQVLQKQLDTHETIRLEEAAYTLNIDVNTWPDVDNLGARISSKLNKRTY